MGWSSINPWGYRESGRLHFKGKKPPEESLPRARSLAVRLLIIRLLPLRDKSGLVTPSSVQVQRAVPGPGLPTACQTEKRPP